MNLPFRSKSLKLRDAITLGASGPAGFMTVPLGLLDQLSADQIDAFARLTTMQMYVRHHGVRAVVDVLARSVGQLPVEARMKSGNTTTPLSATNPLSEMMRLPDPTQPNALWTYAAVVDLIVHGEYIAVLLDRLLVRVDPTQVTVNGTGLNIDSYTIAGTKYAREDVLHVKIYDPRDPRRGLSPLTSVRGVVGEDLAAQSHRVRTWQGGTPGSVIERPLEAPEWSDPARDRFATDWRAKKADEAAVLEEGMRLVTPQLGRGENDYVAGREFVLRAICAVLGVPHQVMGGSDRNLNEGHRQLYQDAIAPLCALIADAINTQIVPRVLGAEQTQGGRIFVQFDLDDKLRGSFREEADAFSTALGGGAYMTPNDVRAIKGLPPVVGGDVLPQRSRRTDAGQA